MIASASSILGARLLYVELYWPSAASLAGYAFDKYSSLEPDVLFDPKSPFIDDDLLSTDANPIEPIITAHSRFPCQYIDTTLFDNPKINFTVGSACASQFQPGVRYWTLARAPVSPYSSGHFGIRMQRGAWIEWSPEICSMDTGLFPWDSEPNPATYAMCVFSCCEPANNVVAVGQTDGQAPGCHTFAWQQAAYASSRCAETRCADGLDDDWDGAIDCADTDCASVAPCKALGCREGEACASDGNACTSDICSGGQCRHLTIPNDCGSRECGRSSSGCFSCGTCPAGTVCDGYGACGPPPAPGCGDGACDSSEDPSTCSADCGAVTQTLAPAPFYGKAPTGAGLACADASSTQWHSAGGVLSAFASDCGVPPTDTPTAYPGFNVRYAFDVSTEGDYLIDADIPNSALACGFGSDRFTTAAHYILSGPGTALRADVDQASAIGAVAPLWSSARLKLGSYTIFLYDDAAGGCRCLPEWDHCPDTVVKTRVWADKVRVSFRGR